MALTRGRGSLPASPSPAHDAEWHSKRGALTHSGGTAPDFHRTSLLCPTWATEGSHGCITARALTATARGSYSAAHCVGSPDPSGVVRGNPVKARDCPAAVSGNERVIQHWLRGGREATSVDLRRQARR